MTKTKRHELILQMLKSNSGIKVGELSKKLQTTTMTIHRDLKELEEQKLIRRVFGGAVLIDPDQPPFFQRKIAEHTKKTAIAQEAAKHIKDGMIVFLDAGTTSLELAINIPKELHITCITTGLKTAIELADHENVSVITIGGMMHSSSYSSIGHYAEDLIQKFNCDLAFISTKAIDSDYGTYEATYELIEVKKEIVKVSSKVILLADSTKFEKKSLSKAIPLSDIDLIVTDNNLDAGVAAKYPRLVLAK